MVRINFFFTVGPEDLPKVQALVRDLVAGSRLEKGCLGYDCYIHSDNPGSCLIVETWQDERALEMHRGSSHFQRTVPEIKRLSSVSSDMFKY